MDGCPRVLRKTKSAGKGQSTRRRRFFLLLLLLLHFQAHCTRYSSFYVRSTSKNTFDRLSWSVPGLVAAASSGQNRWCRPLIGLSCQGPFPEHRYYLRFCPCQYPDLVARLNSHRFGWRLPERVLWRFMKMGSDCKSFDSVLKCQSGRYS